MKTSLSVLFCLIVCCYSYAQNYTSLANGSWTTASNWSNSSGFGAATPSLTGTHNSGTAIVNHNLNVTGNYVLGSATLQINAGKTVTISGDLTVNGGGTINVSGVLQIDGNVTLNSNLNILPGGQVIVRGNATVVSSTYLNVGTNVAPPAYADLIVYQNLISVTSGDITINRNGRVAVFGNVTASGGGTLFTVNNGGQVYVNGNINFTGGGSNIVNNNTTSPYGLYVNGTTTNSGGGSNTTSNQANSATLQSTNPSFFSWVQNASSITLPIQLLYFIGKNENTVIDLEWATASELNFDHFEIEHSSNGLNFTTLDTKSGFGENTHETHAYHYSHAFHVQGINYYRLKSVDMDGQFEYSDVIAMEADAPLEVSTFPNPAHDYIIVKTNFVSNASDRISLTNSNGTEVLRVSVSAAETKIELSESLPRGIYYVQYKGTAMTKTTRVIIE
ncbi:MAG: T9SS type A sorting domain-containing protein [Cyclobacteriaceae bacterium]|nr:T9SS type A sorting domain-containing protein [Cyclobacteriaceae bacterium]